MNTRRRYSLSRLSRPISRRRSPTKNLWKKKMVGTIQPVSRVPIVELLETFTGKTVVYYCTVINLVLMVLNLSRFINYPGFISSKLYFSVF